MAPTHSCRSIVVSCMDFRLWPALDGDLSTRLEGCYDRLLIAGAVRAVVRPPHPSVAEFLLRQIDLAWQLHGVKRAVLVGHTDCGAYGGRAAFTSDEEERAVMAEDLRAARALVTARCPGLEVTSLLAVLTADGEDWRIAVEPVPDAA